MSSPEERWWTVRAGEYVLGTLRGEDLALFERILRHDTSMQAEVARWERRLAPLHESAPERRPGEHVLALVLERIRADGSSSGAAGDGGGGGDGDGGGGTPGPGGGQTATPSAPTRRQARDETTRPGGLSRLWPAVAALATAASVVLGVLLYRGTAGLGAAPVRVDGLAVVLSDESGEPYFLVETDYGNLRVRVTALSPPSIDGDRNFQLWQALPDRSSVRPVALLPEGRGASRVFDVGSLIEGSDLFGVSIEPDGAATDAGPTGPVVAHGDFLPRREADESDD